MAAVRSQNNPAQFLMTEGQAHSVHEPSLHE